MAFPWPWKVAQRKPRPTTGKMAVGWPYVLVVIWTIGAVVLASLVQARFMPGLNNLVFDLYQRLDQRVWDPRTPVRIVDIDEESLVRIGQWPWPRTVIAEIVQQLGGLGVGAGRLGDGRRERAVSGTPDLPASAGHRIPPFAIHIQVCHAPSLSTEIRCASCTRLLVVEHPGECPDGRQEVGR